MKWRYLNPLLWLFEIIGVFGALIMGVGMFFIYLREWFINFEFKKTKKWKSN